MGDNLFDQLTRWLAITFSRRQMSALPAMVLAHFAPASDADDATIVAANQSKRKKPRKRCVKLGGSCRQAKRGKKLKCCAGSVCNAKSKRCRCRAGRKPCQRACIPQAQCCGAECVCPPGQKPCGEACILNEDCCGPDCPCHVSAAPSGSLQAAVDRAPSGGRVCLTAGTFAVPAGVRIAKNLTMIGDGRDATILDAQGQATVLTVQAGVTVFVRDLTITGGAGTVNATNTTTLGGGVWNGGSLTLTRVNVTGNSAGTTNNRSGGGIYNGPAGRLTLDDSNVTGNSAGGDFGTGGGIHSDDLGTVVLTNSSVTGNSAGRWGGGIFSQTGSVTIENSSITGNTAGLRGGGLYSGLSGTSIVESGSSVTGNSANSGGGIHNEGGTVTIEEGATVRDNDPDDCTGAPVNGTCPTREQHMTTIHESR